MSGSASATRSDASPPDPPHWKSRPRAATLEVAPPGSRGRARNRAARGPAGGKTDSGGLLVTVDQIALLAPSRSEVLAEAFDPAAFTDAVHLAEKAVRDYLESNERAGVVLVQPGELMARAKRVMRDPADPTDGRLDAERLAAIIQLYLQTGIHLNSTGYMARQFSSVVPVTSVFDMVTAMAPQPASFYEAGQLANVADKIMAEEFGRFLNWRPGSFDMVTTSGGTLANLTALLAARNIYRQRMRGAGRDQLNLAIAVSEDAHYSVERSAGVMGLESECVLRLPVDDRRRIDMSRVAEVVDGARGRGMDVFALVAAAGSTSNGAIDPLEELAAFAHREQMWLHVDAAHGGAFLVSEHLRERLAGLERADSFCLDAHKTLFVPAAATLLFYRDQYAARRAFNSDASYVFDDPGDEMTEFESGAKNLECTKRPAILNLWLLWALYGPELLAAKLEYLVDLTAAAHEYLSKQPDFQTVGYPQANILCFQYRPPGLSSHAALGALQVAIRDRLRAEGRFLVSKVDLGADTMLRVVFMNHRIRPHDFHGLCAEIRRVGLAIGEDR